MKTVKAIFAWLIVLAFVSTFGACLKEKDDKKPDCRIGTITEIDQRGRIVTLITYNGDGKVATLDILEGNNESTNKVFVYSANTIFVNVTRTNGADGNNHGIIIYSPGIHTYLCKWQFGEHYCSLG